MLKCGRWAWQEPFSEAFNASWNGVAWLEMKKIKKKKGTRRMRTRWKTIKQFLLPGCRQSKNYLRSSGSSYTSFITTWAICPSSAWWSC